MDLEFADDPVEPLLLLEVKGIDESDRSGVEEGRGRADTLGEDG